MADTEHERADGDTPPVPVIVVTPEVAREALEDAGDEVDDDAAAGAAAGASGELAELRERLARIEARVHGIEQGTATSGGEDDGGEAGTGAPAQDAPDAGEQREERDADAAPRATHRWFRPLRGG